MNSLKSRKQLLIAESELNRAQLVQEWQMMRAEVHSLTSQARTIGSIASAAATLVAGLSSLCHKKSPPAAEKPSWWKTLLKGAGLASSFWQAFRSQGHKQDED
jgi:HPt (histidine-containing phosphotransfer) domain-containing protein